MTFFDVVAQALELLQRYGRVSYRALKLQFQLDDEHFEALKDELIFQQAATDEDGKGLVWTGGTADGPPDAQAGPQEPATATPAVSFDGERRQVTVMFCDLVDSTKLSQRLDPEDYRAVVRTYQEAAVAEIQPFDGYIAQYLGDGLMVYFGWPQAHEDAAQRAAYASLAIVNAMGALNDTRLEPQYGVRVAVRIGLHTGMAVIGEMGDGERHEQLAMGDTPNIASRIQGLAAPDTVAISAATARLVQGDFALEDLGMHTLKGVAEPMQVFRVLGPIEGHGDEEEATAAGVPFLVGRDEEIGLLLRRWEQSKEGLGQVVLVSGEAGIGKSALVDVLRAQVRHQGLPRIAFRCSPYHRNSALYPVITHVQHLLHFERDDTAEAKLDKLEQVLQTYNLPREQVVPLFAALLSVPLDDRYAAPELTPQQQKQQTLDALVAWLLQEAERQPVLAVWEDLHWADPSTLEMLSLVLEQTPTVPMLSVLTFRPEFHPPWPMRSHLTPLTLNRLERPQVEALITQLAGGKSLPVEVVRHIVTKTDGVPLFIEELTKMLLESDLLQEAAGHYELTGSLATATIPATLQDSLMARLDRLPTGREVAQVGSVVGRDFSYELLQAIAPMDGAVLQAGLAQLVDAELLYQRGRPPQATYVFKHALIRDAAYTSLLRSTRQQLHQQIAQQLEERFPDTVETQPDLLAQHYAEAGLMEPAVDYWYKAGRHAMQGSANVEAIAHLHTGLEALSTLPETSERAQRELDVQIMLGSVWMEHKGYGAAEVEQAFRRAQDLCQQLQLDTSPRFFRVLNGLRRVYANRGMVSTAQELSEQCLRLAQHLQNSAMLHVSHYSLGLTLYQRGDVHAALSHLEQGLAHEPMVTRSGTAAMPICRVISAHVLWACGYPDQAHQRSLEALSIVEDDVRPYDKAWTIAILAFLSQYRREVALTRQRAETAMALATEHGFPYMGGWATTLRGWALAMQGQQAEGGMQMRQGMAALLATGALANQAYFLALLAEVQGSMGQVTEALQTIAEALALVAKTEERTWEAELHRLKGELLLAQSGVQRPRSGGFNPETESTPEACFHHALDIARSQQAKSLELRAAMSLSRLWRQQGECDQARQLLAEVYNWFTEGFDTADLQEARALLD